MKRRHLLVLVSLALLAVGCKTKKSSMPSVWTLASPDSLVAVRIHSTSDSASTSLTYQVLLTGENDTVTALEPSKLGIVRSDADFTNLIVTDVATSSGKTENYTMLTGKKLHNEATYNELIIKADNPEKKKIEIVFRAYNEGIAFRYYFPDTSDSALVMLSEATSFNLPDQGDAWIQPYDSLAQWSPAYEYGYVKDLKTGARPPKTTGWGFPALFATADAVVLITEAGLDDSYCGSHLTADCDKGEYALEFAHAWECYGLYPDKPASTLPWATPWRVVIAARTFKPVVESCIVNHLATPCQLKDTSWIKPGIASWSWWGDHVSGRDFKKLKQFVDFSAEMGWPYSLVDADWHIMQGGTLEQLAAYADSKGVGLWIWYNSAGPHTKVMDAGPRDLMHEREIRRKEMERISKLGIKGIKVDFFQSDKQEIIKLYLDLIRDAADYHLMVLTHGCTVPRGWSRTYPNLLSMEGVRGGELYSWSGFPAQGLWLNTVYPFTRNVIGSMDYTPIAFSDYDPQCVHLTTNAHELALGVIFESGIQHPADRVESYRKQPAQVIDFLRRLPVIWDETVFIEGWPGKYVVLARRSGPSWYLAGINSQDQPQPVTLDPAFIGSERFVGEMITDGNSARTFAFAPLALSADSVSALSIAPRGGFVARLEKE